MAFFSIAHIAVKGVSAAVPKTSASNHELSGYGEEEIEKLVATLGIENRRIATRGQCASDLCMAAAEKLIEELKWNKSEIEALFFVTQTPDHHVPGTSMYLQEKLGLPKSCVTFDINQGCAGYVYGLSLISGFMSSSKIKKGLLLVGDTITSLISPYDKSLLPLFADAGTATALMYDEQAEAIEFNISTEGNDFAAIIIPGGGARKPLSDEAFGYHEFEGGIKRKDTHLAMKGLDVFNFSLKKVAPNVETLLDNSVHNKNDIDRFVFHQANRLILDAIIKKLNLDAAKVPSSLKDYGNTSGASIPLTIVTSLKTENKIEESLLLLSGFGVGLSLASAIVKFNNVVCPELIEL